MGTVSKVSELGIQLKAFRLDRGWTQQHMANVLGISRVTLNKLERGNVKLLELTEVKIRKQYAQLVPKVA